MARDTRARMIETTARLLQHRGYYGTALSDILAESGAPRGSLYFHFPGGKDQLVREATQAAVDETTRELEATMATADPALGVRRFLEGAAGLLRRSGYTFGCPVAPVVLDLTAEDPALAEICRRAFDAWARVLRRAFGRAGLAASRSKALALLVLSSLEGLLILARARRDVAPLRAVALELEALIRRELR